MTDAEQRLLTALADHGRWQREDGLRCEPGMLGKVEGLGFWWASLRLRWAGLIERKRFPNHTLWASCERLWFYRITDAGRALQGETP